MAAEKRFHAVAKGGAATTPTTSSPLSFMKSKLVLLVSHELSLSGKHKKKKKNSVLISFQLFAIYFSLKW